MKSLERVSNPYNSVESVTVIRGLIYDVEYHSGIFPPRMKVAFLRIGVPRQFYLKGLNQIFQVLIFPKWPSLPSATQRIAIYFREMHIFLSINFTGENAYYNAHFVNTDCSLYLSPTNQRQAGHLSASPNPPFFSRLFSNKKSANEGT